MFRRIAVEDWQNTLAMLSFGIFFAVFMLTIVRLWLTPRQHLERLEALPLADDTHD